MDLAVRNQRLIERVGAVSLTLIAALVVMQLALDDCHFDDGVHVTVYFEHLGGLHQGSDFQVAGRVIGEVDDISLVSSRRARPGHPLHPGGGVAVRVRIESARRHLTTRNGEVFISTKGMFGQKYLEMSAPLDGAARERPLEDGDEVRGVDPPHLDRVLMRSYRNILLARSFMSELRPEWDDLSAALSDLGTTLESFDTLPAAALVGVSIGEVVDSARALEQTLDETGVTRADIANLVQRARELATRLDSELATLSGRVDTLVVELDRIRAAMPDDLVARFEAALIAADDSIAKIRNIGHNLEALATMVRRGEGTVGALWNDPEFPEHAKGLGRFIKKHPWRLLGRESVE